MGGPHSRTDGNLASVDIYDPVSDTWKDGRDILGLTNKIYNIAVVGFDRRVHVLGGNYNLAHRVYSPGALVLDVTGRADDTQLSWVTVAGRTATLSGNDYSSRILVSEGNKHCYYRSRRCSWFNLIKRAHLPLLIHKLHL